MRIFNEFTFEAAHRLPNVPAAHKCYNLHGHHYRVRLEVNGEVNPTLGWVIDFAVLDAISNVVKGALDHKLLNEIEGLANPTAEMIAEWILKTARTTIHPISSVIVWETPNCGAIAE